MKKIPLKTLIHLLLQAHEAYDNGGPDYIRVYMIELVRELRAWCDGVEHLLEHGPEEMEPEEATV